MSDCYTTFYFELPLPSPAVCEEVETLLTLGDDYHSLEGEAQEKAAVTLGEVFELFGEYEEMGFQWEVRSFGLGDDMKHNLSVYSDESGNTTHAADLIEWLLPKLDIQIAGFEFACYGDGENGGGAMFVNMVDGKPVAEWMNTYSWLEEATK